MKNLLFLLLISITIYSCKKTEFDAVQQAKTDKAIIQKYIRDSSLVADSTTSGLYYSIIDSGMGAHPYDSAYLSVYYKGYLVNGTLFDQNKPGLPSSIFLHNTIAGWKEGVPKIKKKGIIKLLIPSALGYGNQVAGTIPANSVLIFDIKLDNFQ